MQGCKVNKGGRSKRKRHDERQKQLFVTPRFIRFREGLVCGFTDEAASQKKLQDTLYSEGWDKADSQTNERDCYFPFTKNLCLRNDHDERKHSKRIPRQLKGKLQLHRIMSSSKIFLLFQLFISSSRKCEGIGGDFELFYHLYLH